MELEFDKAGWSQDEEGLWESLPDEERAQYYRFWVGSSKYDTEEMAKLIDGVIEEAKALDIETATPEELARMKEEWGRAQADQGG